MSSSKINFGLTPNLFAFSNISAFEPILLSIQNKSKFGLSFNASKPIEPQPAPISQITPFFGALDQLRFVCELPFSLINLVYLQKF